MAKSIMIQGTMSNAGKSLLTAGLCRVFKQDGYRVAPFKSQNMALNSFITRAGMEMGRAQAVQAEACGIEPDVRMNPILLKPVTDMGSQVIVMGEPLGNMSAVKYFSMKRTLIPSIMDAYRSLAAENDIIVLEGAGSPAEINLKKDDIVNMGMAKLAGSPVLLVGDIDRGGVFAQLYGTIALLEKEEQDMIKATVVNKFRGDVSLLKEGLSALETLTGKPVAGVLPMMNVDIEDEDSLAERLERRARGGTLEIAAVRLPHLSNFTDFAALEATPGMTVRYARTAEELQNPDMIVLPGTKNTMADMKWLRETGMEAAVKRFASAGGVVFGICGGYQMLGRRIADGEGAEGGGEIDGMGLLPVTTEFSSEKRRVRTGARALNVGGILSPLSGIPLEGYELHMGRTELLPGASPLIRLEDGGYDGCQQGNIYGSYLHGFFDTAECREAVLSALCRRKGVETNMEIFDFAAYRQEQYDRLAENIRTHLNMELIYRILDRGIG